MALSKLPSATVEGVTALAVEVEVDVATGLPGFIIVGLADRAVEESKERVRSAIKHSGYQFPLSRITVHLSPSEKKKTGVHFDLPIALGILLADGQLERNDRFNRTLFLGGLSLDGTLQSVTGCLSLVEWAKQSGFKRIVLPQANYEEASLITGPELVPLSSLQEVIGWLGGEARGINPPKTKRSAANFDADWLQVQGQQQAKRAALIAAAGGHNLLLEGPPGAGKTLLARGLRALLPPLEREELIEVVKLHSLAGQLDAMPTLDGVSRPFRSPHHTSSQIAVVGGGTHPRPGEISLAHHGVLFLDELPEFPRSVVEALRQPLEDGQIHVSRVQQTTRYPARFILVATMNPCPCGWLGSNQKECRCTPHQVAQYRKKVSGPILDRIDLFLRVPAVTFTELTVQHEDRPQLEEFKKQIAASRQLQRQRNRRRLNSQLKGKEVSQYCEYNDEAKALLEQASQKMTLSARGYHKVLKVARTIADLSGKAMITAPEVAEALQYRFTDDW